jgi:phage tail protein X
MEATLHWEGDRAPFAKAFVAAQKATEAVKKASTNPAFRSKYADLAGVVEAVVPALNEHGIAVLQHPGFDGDLVSVTTELLHESGASVRSTLSLRPSKNDPQGVGSAVTYGRRYALLAMTGAAPEDDDGNLASGPRTEARRSAPQEPREAAPSAKPVDRTAEAVPLPTSDDAGDWEAWRKVLATKINRAKTVAEVNAVQKANAEGIAACAKVLPDTVERMAAFVSDRTAAIEGDTFPGDRPSSVAGGNGHAAAH